MNLDDVVTVLNNWMEENSELYCNEFNCEFEDLVSDWGFGYCSRDNNISYLIGGNEIHPISMSFDSVVKLINNESLSKIEKLNLLLEE